MSECCAWMMSCNRTIFAWHKARSKEAEKIREESKKYPFSFKRYGHSDSIAITTFSLWDLNLAGHGHFA